MSGWGALARFGETAVWSVALDADGAGGPEDAALLSRAERARAASLRHEDVRRRFVAARAALRRLLASEAGGAPAALVLEAGPHGKPWLRGGPRFSLSHAGELALLALDARREVGVDVERVRPVAEANDIAATWFAPEERLELAAAGDDGGVTFARLWTRREAWLKALGVGLDEALAGQPIDRARWAVAELVPAPGHVAALAVERPRAAGER